MEVRRYSPASGKIVEVGFALTPMSASPNVFSVSSNRVAGVVFISDSLDDLVKRSARPHVLGVHCARDENHFSSGVRNKQGYLNREPDWFAFYNGLMDIDTDGGLALVSDLIECYVDATKPKDGLHTRRLAALVDYDAGKLIVHHRAPELVEGTKPWRFFR